MKKQGMQKNAILNGFKTILTVIFPLITFPYASRVLGVENIGKVNFSNSIVNYFVLLAGLGITTYATREGARIRDDKERLSAFCNQIFSINIITTSISYVALVVCMFVYPSLQGYKALLVVQGFNVIGTTIGIHWLYQIYEDYLYITVRTLFFQILSLVLLFTLVRNSGDYIMYAAVSVVSNVGSNILNFFHSRKYLKLRFSSTLNLKKHLKPIFVIFASTIAITIYVNSDTTMLGIIGTDYNVGIYSTSVKIYTVFKQLISAMILVSLPRLSNLWANGKKDEYYQNARMMLNMILVVVLPVIVGINVLANQAVLILAGKSYIEAVASLRILSVGLLFSVFGTFYTNAILLPLRKEKGVLVATVVSAVLNIGLNCFLIPIYFENAAAFTTVIAEAGVLIVQILYGKSIKLGINKMDLSGVIIASIIMGAVCCFINSKISGVIFSSIIVVLVGVIIYFLFLYIFKNSLIMQIKDIFCNKKQIIERL